MEERQSRLSNMDWKRFRPYLCVRLIPQNSMFSNFCHVLKDSTNIILAIGNPIENLKIDSLFNSVIFDHLSKKGHSVNL